MTSKVAISRKKKKMHEAPAFVEVFLLRAAGATTEPCGSSGCDLHGRCLRAGGFAPHGRQCVLLRVCAPPTSISANIAKASHFFFTLVVTQSRQGKRRSASALLWVQNFFWQRLSRSQATEAEWPGLCAQMPMGCCPLVRGEEKEAESGTAVTSLCCRK